MDICRTCADECSAELVPIFSKLDGRFIATVIVNCSDVSIKEDDGLPTYVCATCLVKIEQILSFARQVREADRKLRQLFKLEAPAETMTNEQDHFITIPMEVEVKMEVEDEDELNANHDRKETNILVEKQESDDFEDDNDSDWKGDDKSSDESREDGEKPKRPNRRKPIAVVNLDPEGESCKTTRRRTRRKADDEENAVEAESSETKCRKASKPSRDYNTDDGDDDVNSDLDEVELEIYTLVQPKDGTVFCCHCHKDFPSMNELLDHGKQKHSKKVRKVNYSKKFVCDVCYCRYMTQDALDEHYAMRAKLHTRKIYECSRCSNRFATVKRRRLHAHNHPKYQEALDTDLEEQKERIVTCCMKTCNQTFLTKEELLEHGEKEHSSNKAMVTNPLKPHECPVCFKTFEKLESLKRHRYRIFMSSVQCSICGKQVKNRNALYNHERLHNSDKTNACEICGKGFKMIAQLKNHYTVHNDEKPFVCKECGWSFKRSSTLKHHMLQHTDMQPWKCEVCGKCFKTVNMTLCRTCAEKRSVELVPIFSKLDDKFIANIIVNCSDISINEDDGLPSYVCSECMAIVKQILSFANLVRESDRKLRLLLKAETLSENVHKLESDHEESNFVTVPLDVDIKLEVDQDEVDQNLDKRETNVLGSDQESDDFEDDNDSDWKGDGKSSDEECQNRKVTVKRRTRLKPVSMDSLETEDEKPKRSRRSTRTRQKAGEETDNVEEGSPELKRSRSRKSTKDSDLDDENDGVDSELDEVEREMFTLVQVEENRHFCCLCYKDFASRSELVDHGMLKHSKKTRKVNYSKKFACEVCYCRYVTEDALEEHKAITEKLHTRKIYQCLRCSNRFATVKRRRMHAHNHPKYNETPDMDLEEQKERPVTCCMKTCNKMFPSKEELFEHSKQEHLSNRAEVKNPSRPHECPVCFKTFEKLQSLKRHRYRIFMSSMQCSICGKQFKNRNALYTHERKHNSDKAHACEICGKRFMLMTQLKNHYAVHNDDKPFVCKECGWSFKRNCNLKHHMLQHTDMLPWKCEVCGKCFKINEDDGLPSYVCSECMVIVKQILSFANLVRESDRKLRLLLKAETLSENVRKLESDHEESNFVTVPLDVDIKLEVDQDEVDQNLDKRETNVLGSDQESDDFEDDNDSDWKGDGKSSDEECQNRKVRVNRRTRLKTVSIDSLETEDEKPKRSRRSTRTRQKAGEETDNVEEGSPELKRSRSRKSTKDSDLDDENDGDSELDEVEREMFTLVQVEENRHFCCLCYKDFASRSELVDHGMLKHSKKTRKVNYSKKFACEVCYCRYVTEDALEEHKAITKKLHTRKIYQCLRCSNRFATVRRRRMHAHNHPKYNETPDPDLEEQKERPVTCCMKTCNKMFPSKEELFEHSQQEHMSNRAMVKNPSRPHECPVCFKTFEKLQSLKRHRYRILMSSMQCSICGKQFKNRNALYTHERKHNSDKAHACEICGKRFMLMTQLKNHYAVHKDEKPFVCKECGWSFKRNCNLKHHMLQHTDMLPWKCEVCGKCFKGKYHLQYHMRIHTGHKPWKCRYCEKSFADHANRARHETSHTGIKPYKCTYCDKTFIRRRFQIEHESTHTGIKPYRCERCNLTFGQKSALKKHLDIHPLAPENQLSLAQPSPMPLSVADSPMPSPSPSSMPPPPPPPSSTANPSHSSTGHPSPSGVPYPHM